MSWVIETLRHSPSSWLRSLKAPSVKNTISVLTVTHCSILMQTVTLLDWFSNSDSRSLFQTSQITWTYRGLYRTTQSGKLHEPLGICNKIAQLNSDEEEREQEIQTVRSSPTEILLHPPIIQNRRIDSSSQRRKKRRRGCWDRQSGNSPEAK